MAARTQAACLHSSANCPAPDDLGPLGSDEPEDYIGPPPTTCKGPQGIDQRATMVTYDEYLYPYWERPKSKRPPGAPLPPPAPPLTKLFNIDSIESPLKALELAKTQPYAFALPRSDDESRIPRTDDDAAPASALVSTNFSNAAEAITFLDSVCGGSNPRFSVSYELLALDTPRKRRSVLVTTKPTQLSIPDRTDAPGSSSW